MQLQPNETIEFQRPFTGSEPLQQNLKISNTSKNTIIFKVKTTAPKQYCVRPNAASVKAGESKNIAIILQPMSEDPPADVKSKDKFLIQALQVDGNEDAIKNTVEDGVDIWQVAEKHKISGTDLMQEKLKVEYLPAATPSSVSFAPDPESIVSSNAAEVTPTPVTTKPVDLMPADQNKRPPVPKRETPKSPLPQTVEAVKEVAGTNLVTPVEVKEVKSDQRNVEVESLKNQVETLQKQLAELSSSRDELRQRVIKQQAPSQTPAALKVATKEQQFPLNVVVAVAVIAFILGALLI